MFWKSKLTRYAIKNFKDHMHIKNDVTLKGLIRKFNRQYPRTSTFISRSFILCSIYFISMTLIPGSTLPLQKQSKILVMDVYYLFLYIVQKYVPVFGTTTFFLLPLETTLLD